MNGGANNLNTENATVCGTAESSGAKTRLSPLLSITRKDGAIIASTGNREIPVRVAEVHDQFRAGIDNPVNLAKLFYIRVDEVMAALNQQV
jgi:hypothetical protein